MNKGIYRDNDYYGDFKEMINKATHKYNNDIAFTYSVGNERKEKTFEQLRNDINSLGTYLYNEGYKNSKIAILSENSYEWIISYFAIVCGNNVVVPIDKELKANEISSLLESGEVSLIIYSKQKEKTVEEMEAAGLDIRKIRTDELEEDINAGAELIKNGYNEYIDCVINPEEMCELIFTSGTTGKPKGVMLSQKNLMSDAYNSIRVMVTPRNTIAVLPFNHTFGMLASVLCQIWMGYQTHINSSLKYFMRDVQQTKPGHLCVVPLFVENIYKNIWKNAEKQGKASALKKLIKISNGLRRVGIDARRKLFKSVIDGLGGNLSVIYTGGAPIDEEYITFFKNIGITLINGFGITECSPIVSLDRESGAKPGTAGIPIPGVEIKILNPDEDGEGEILVKGDIVMMGYYKNPEATKRVMLDGWFNTEDMGSISEDNVLKISGRKKNLIILANGKNVYPEELENLISHIENVSEVLVYEENGVITAEIYSEEGEKFDSVRERIKADVQTLNTTIASYKQIRKVKFRQTEFEKTTTRKIKRNYNK